MRQRVFASHNRSEPQYNRAEGSRGKHQREKQNNKHIRWSTGKWIILLAVVLISAIIYMLAFRLECDPLKGRWCVDDVTAYEFDGSGNGRLLLPTAEYLFTYHIDEELLCVDFIYEEAKDAEYIFYVEINTLILDGGNDTTRGYYILSKSE